MQPRITKVTLDGRFGSGPGERPVLRVVFDYQIPLNRALWVGLAYEVAETRPWYFHNVRGDTGEHWAVSAPEFLGADLEFGRNAEITALDVYLDQVEIHAARVVDALEQIVQVHAQAEERAHAMTIKVSVGVQRGRVSFVHSIGGTNYKWDPGVPLELPPAAEIQAEIEASERDEMDRLAAHKKERATRTSLERMSAARRGSETREINRKVDVLKAEVDAWKPEPIPRWVCASCGKVVVEPHDTPAETSQLYVTNCPGRGGHVWELKPEVT